METGRSGNVFSVKNFRLVFFGALVSELGAILYSFAVGFYILEISDNNAFLQGLYLALCGVTLLIFTPVGGVLGDRCDKAKIMFVCDYVKGGIIIAATLLMIAFPSHGAHVVILFAAGIFGNAASGIFNPASGALLPYIVKEDKLQQANAYFSVKSALQSILGIVLAGVLYAALPINALFFIVGACYVLSGVSEMFIRYDFVPKEEKLGVKSALADMASGFKYLKAQKAITAIILACLFVNFFITPLTSNFIPYFVKTDVALAPSYLFDGLLTPELWSSVFGMLFGASALVGSLILSAKAQDDKCGGKIALRLCAMAAAMAAVTAAYRLLVVTGASLNAFLGILCLTFVVLGFLVVLINVPLSTALMKAVEKDKLSKVTSIISIFSQGLVPISSVAAGAVLQYLGSTPLLFVCAAGFAATAIALLLNKHAKEI